MGFIKRILLGILSLFVVLPVFAIGIYEEGNTYAPYAIRMQFIGGVLFPHNKTYISPLVKGPMLGGEVAFEWNTDGSKPWHYHLNGPNVGLAFQVIDLGNPELTGQMLALYPYVNIPCYKNKTLSLNVKIGCGIDYCTKPFDAENAKLDPREPEEMAADYNFAIGGPVGLKAMAAMNLDVKVHKNILLTADVSFNHFSSANLYNPNYGLNLFNGYLGLKYLPVYKEKPAQLDTLPAITKRWSGEIVLSGSAKKLHYLDNNYYGCASLNIEGYYRTCPQHRVGVGVDVFFSDSYRKTVDVGENGKYYWTNENTHFKRTCITEDNIANKFRVGINIANELTINKVGAFLHVGMYLYDPIKNMEPGDECLESLNAGAEPKQKGLFYPYDIQNEDGWCYLRLGLRYHITPHFLINGSVKLSLTKADFFEFGVGYAF